MIEIATSPTAPRNGHNSQIVLLEVIKSKLQTSVEMP
jgi:hypothetical protein